MKLLSYVRLSAAFSLCLLASQQSVLADFHYTVTRLPTPGLNSQANDINETGTVVGAAQNDSANFYEVATYWKNGEYIEFTGLATNPAIAVAVNDFDQIVGETDEGFNSAFFWDNGVLTQLENLPGSTSNWMTPRAYDINNDGHVVGSAVDANSSSTAVIWRNGVISDLNSEMTGGDALELNYAYAINNNGDIAGSGYDGTTSRAFLMSQGVVTTVEGIDSSSTIVRDMNESQQIVGWTRFPDTPTEKAFVWENGSMIRLPGLDSFYETAVANDINNNGRIVGAAQEADSSYAAVIWENGTIFRLNDLITPGSGWDLGSANAINDANVIVGTGTAPGSDSVNTDIFLLSLITVDMAQGVPGAAGQVNSFAISNAAAGERIMLFASAADGARFLPGCNGKALSLNSPRVLGSAIADERGNATIDVTIPAALSGRTVKLQGVQLSSCEITDVITQTF